MAFEESAPLRAVSFHTGLFKPELARFALDQDGAGWKVSNDRAQESRWYESLPADAYTAVPRRLEDLPAGELEVALVEEPRDTGPAAVEQAAADPDLFNVHGIWHGGGGRQDFQQTFEWASDEPLGAVRVRVRDFSPPFHGGVPGATLELAIAEQADGGGTGEPVGRWRGPMPDRLRHSTWLELRPGPGAGRVPLRSGVHLRDAALSFPEPARNRHLSLSAVTGDPYGGGRLLRARNGGGFEPLERGAEADLSFQLLTSDQAEPTR